MTNTDWRDNHFGDLRELVLQHAGLVFREDQGKVFSSAVELVMQQLGVKDLTEFQRAVRSSPSMLQALVDKLTIGETYFFREPKHFEFLRTGLFSDLCRAGEKSVRIWSAACATGEEPYSMAMLADSMGISQRVHILATDISAQNLERARTAMYRKWSLRGDFRSLTNRYLRHHGDRYLIESRIADRVQFESLNLVAGTYPAPGNGTSELDVIFCRNVLIYFDSATIERITQRLFRALKPGGWLVTASGDPILSGISGLEHVSTEHGFYYRKPLPCSGNVSDRIERAEPMRIPRPAAVQKPALPRPSQPILNERSASTDNPRADWLSELKCLADTDSLGALQQCERAVTGGELSAEVHYYYGLLLVEHGRTNEAIQAIRRTLYIDDTIAVAHFLLGTLMKTAGYLPSAIRHFNNARDLCAAVDCHCRMPLSDDRTAADLLEAIEAQFSEIDCKTA